MRVAVCVFAKPPLPGLVKTRLAASVGAEAAAALALAFFADTWATVKALPGVDPVLAVPEASPTLAAITQAAPVWLQGPGDLGAKMEAVAARGFAEGYGAIIEIGADSPGLPPAFLLQALALLQQHEAVIGPSDDGGFYLLGLRRHQPSMLADLPWSVSNTRRATEARLLALGFSLAHVPDYFDVDDGNDLRRLREALAQGQVEAPHTMASLAKLAVAGNHAD